MSRRLAALALGAALAATLLGACGKYGRPVRSGEARHASADAGAAGAEACEDDAEAGTADGGEAP